MSDEQKKANKARMAHYYIGQYRSRAESSFAAPTLLAAVELVCEKWSWIQAGTREPLSIALKRPEREMDVFEMVVSMNNLRTQYEKWKAANDQAQRPVPDTGVERNQTKGKSNE